MTKIPFYATGKHLVEHLFHLYEALPDRYRGRFYARGRAATRAEELGIDVSQRSVPKDERSLVCVASYPDYRNVNPAKVILVNHGVGQTYSDGHGLHHSGYSGGKGRERVVLNLCPSERDADLCRSQGQRAVAVGVPYLDGFHNGFPPLAASEPVTSVAFSFHADIHVVPETQWAFPHYDEEITRIIRRDDRPFDIIGHGHPRVFSHFRTYWARRKIPFMESWWDVLEDADLYVCDNSCVAPDTPVLCADLTWRPAGELAPGDEVIACDEERTVPWKNTRRESRRFRTATIVENKLRLLPCYRVTTTHGELVVSSRHPWLVREEVVHDYLVKNRKGEKVQSHRSRRTHWAWRNCENLRVGDKVAFFAQPWIADRSYEAGWLSGILDGEGCLSGRHISVTQVEGLVLDEIEAQLAKRNLGFTDQITSQNPNCHKLTLHGSLAAKLTLLGTLRPIRLLDKARAREFWNDFKVNSQVERAEVLEVEYLGLQEVSVMATSEKTFIAGGFIAHNSTLYEFASTNRPVLVLNAPWYRREVEHGMRFWSHIPGLEVDEPEQLYPSILSALKDSPTVAKRRADAVDYAYGDLCDGKATERAVNAVVDFMESWNG